MDALSDLSSVSVKGRLQLLLGGPSRIFQRAADPTVSECRSRHQWDHQCQQIQRQRFQTTADRNL